MSGKKSQSQPRNVQQAQPAPVVVVPPTPSTQAVQLTPQQMQNLQHMQQQQQQPQQPRVKDQMRGQVRAVLSGDSFVIVAVYKSDPNKPAVERTVSLSGIIAPRMGRVISSNNAVGVQPDEGFAWDSREFLRKKIIGQTLICTIDYSTTQGREFVTVQHQNENLAIALVKNGLATVRQQTTGRDPRPELEALLAAEEEAKSAKRGVWNEEAKAKAIRPIYEKFDSLQFFEECNGKTLNGIVEQAKTGSVFRVTLLPSFRILTVVLAGVTCPSVRWVEKTKTLEADPFGKEARAFVEANLLHRDVTLNVHAIDKNDDLIATVTSAGRDVGSELLNAGFGSFSQWSAPRDPGYCAQLKALELKAKNQRLRLWSLGVPMEAIDSPTSAFEGEIIDIPTPGILVVLDPNTNEEHRLTLSSVIVPRVFREDVFAKEVRTDEDFRLKRAESSLALEAREFLRKTIFGKKALCTLDYERTPMVAGGGYEDDYDGSRKRAYYTVIVDKDNVAELLLSKGYAKTVNHKAEEACSPVYGSLCLAEKRAEKLKLGWWNLDAVKVAAVNDLTQNQSAINSKKFLPFLERGDAMHRCIVEYVFSGTRLKLFIPSQSCMISFCLSAVRGPRKEEASKKLFADKGLALTKRLCHMHQVNIEVEGLDKAGNFLGNLTVDGVNLAVLLADEGLVAVAEGATRNPHASKLLEAEKRAKAARKNLWENYDPESEQPGDAASPGKQVIDVVVSDIRTPNDFYVQIVSSESLAALDTLRESLSSISLGTRIVPEARQQVAAMYSEDNCWYRAQVLSVDDANMQAVVQFIDYGNVEVVPWNNLQPLPDSFQKYPAQALRSSLAYCVSLPQDNDFYRDSLEAFRTLVQGKNLKAIVESRKSGTMHLVLSSETQNVNVELVKAGLCRVETIRNKSNQTYTTLFEAQQYARENRVNIWRHGDFFDSDDEGGGRKRSTRSRTKP